MNINGTEVMLSEEDRKWIKLFFQKNSDFMKKNSLIEYENIKKFADLYEQFLEKNNLKDNDILKLFLVELRYDQLSYKITTNSNRVKMKRMALSIDGSNIKLSNSIQKWYKESNVKSYIPSSEIEKVNRSIETKVKQNRLERKKGLESAKNTIVS